MKSLLLFIVAFLVNLSVFSQDALPDLKINIKDFDKVQTKYPYIDEIPNNNGHPYEFRLVPGDIVRLEVEIENVGQATSGKFTLEVQLGNTINGKTEYQIFKQNFASLDPGKDILFKQDVPIKTKEGDFSYKANITWMEKEDYNTNNNIETTGSMLVWRSSSVESYLRPELSVTLTSPDNNRHIQRTVKLVATVTNSGKASSAPTTMVLKCKDKKTKTQNVPALKPGESFAHEFQHKWPTVGTKNCEINVDPQNIVKEKDEWNNKADMKVYIKL